MERTYAYAVVNDSATLVPASPAFFQEAATAPRPGNIPSLRSDAASSAGLETSLVPSTPLFELMQEYKRIAESRVYTMNAAYESSRARLIFQVAPVSTAHLAPDALSTAQMFTAETTLDALIQQASEEQKYTLAQAKAQFKDWSEQYYGRGQRPEMPEGEKLRQYYTRPDMFDDPLFLDDNMKVAHVSRPTVVNDVHLMEDRFAARVAAAMGVTPALLNQPLAGTATDASMRSEKKNLDGARTIETQADRDTTVAVESERHVYARLFAHVYSTVLAPMNQHALSDVYTALHTRREELRMDKRTPAALVAALGGDAAEPAAEDTEDSAEVKVERKQLRRSMKRVRALMQQLQSESQAAATLVFEPQQTQAAMSTLAGMLELADRDRIDSKQLEPAARAVFGKSVSLHEPIANEQARADLKRPPGERSTRSASPAKKRKK
jgi:hypothetical protein